MKLQFDSIDKKVISSLQQDGRMKNNDLARLANISPPAMLERVKRLVNGGVIKGYAAEIDPVVLGYNLQAIVMIKMDRKRSESLDEMEQIIRAIPEVKDCFLLAGSHDIMVRLIVRDVGHLSELSKYTLPRLGMKAQETFMVLSPPKEAKGYSLDLLGKPIVAR